MSKVGDDIIEGLKEALAYARGEEVPGLRVHHVEVDDIDPRAIRQRLKLTQQQMADFLGTSASG